MAEETEFLLVRLIAGCYADTRRRYVSGSTVISAVFRSKQAETSRIEPSRLR
jgi:hypothetical protein